MTDVSKDEPRLRTGRLSLPLALAQSIGIQGPTAGVIVGPAFVASVVGQPGALAQVVALVAMGFVAYAFVRFARRFNSAGSVYGYNGVAVGPRYGFASAWLLLLVYLGFAAGVFASTAEIALALFDSAGFHPPWQVVAIACAVLAFLVAALGIAPSSTIVLVLEAASVVLVAVVAVKVIADGGFEGHGLRAAPFTLDGVGVSVLALGVVQVFGQFSGFEGAATLGEEARDPQRAIPVAVATSLVLSAGVYIFFTWVVYSAYPTPAALAADPAPLVHIAKEYIGPTVGVIVNVAGVMSGFGAVVALLNAAARLIFTFARDLDAPRLSRTSRRSGTPIAALTAAAGISLVGLLLFSGAPTPARAASLLIQYAAYLLLLAYAMTLVAAVVSAWRTDRRAVPIAILVIGVGVVGYILYRTLVPFPEVPFNRLVIAAAVTIVAGIALPFAPRLRRAVASSMLLAALRAGERQQRA